MDIEVAPGVTVWAESVGAGEPLLLVMGANTSSAAWPAELVERLAEHHRVLRYDHRDTGRSTHAFDERPYAIADLAADAVAVLDAFGVDRAHAVGMSLGGTLVQLLLADHPDRLRSATVFCTAALSGWGSVELPGPDPALLRMWGEFTDERTLEQELDWRVEHWRLLHGTGLEFDAEWFRALEERVMAHSGREDNPAAHAVADPSGLERDLSATTLPVLVIEAPEDPVNPPPHAAHLASTIAGAELVRVEGLGHALAPALVPELAATILKHTLRVTTL
ncbi:alpha/beta fold hydrolase [Pseudonocardia oroxyli]|uniref:Pimeloyl-ACP methyl ester carboxylesterase n=1 Tax=Pseudonocardia oroxyli TaxID=366584 RepID=A0A1G7VSB3_PSEOR|nr:alpha/beta hydrolase [Pseudonocardia oroxyli]SDG62309.1 Pimeloyl-ACP methyl ester carboxylesterase [Pseudonocardia oroxyli]